MNGFTYPVAQYDDNEGREISGGFVYRGWQSSSLVGTYVFGDFAQEFVLPSGSLFFIAEPVPGNFEIRRFQITEDDLPYGLFLKGFGEDEDGEIYTCGSEALAPFGNTGVVERIVVVQDAGSPLESAGR